mgnify:CR=1 FL=1
MLENVSEAEALAAFWKIRKRERCGIEFCPFGPCIKVGAGPDRRTTDYYMPRLHHHLRKMRRELNNGTYLVGPLRKKVIVDILGKERQLGIAGVMDRVVYDIIFNRLSGLDHLLSPHAVAFRKGIAFRRVIDAIAIALEKAPFFLITDVRNYFPSISEEILEKTLAGLPLGKVERAFLENFNHARPKKSDGLPQGIAISPALANHAFTDHDNWLSGFGGGYLRYADDLFFCFPTEEGLSRMKTLLAGNRIGSFTIHEPETGKYPEQEPEFLGVILGAGGRRPGEKASRRLTELVKKGDMWVAGWERHFSLQAGVPPDILSACLRRAREDIARPGRPGRLACIEAAAAGAIDCTKPSPESGPRRMADGPPEADAPPGAG